MRLIIISMPVIAFVALLTSSIQGKYDEAASTDSYHPEVRAMVILNLNRAKTKRAFADRAALRRACALAR